MYLLPCLPKCWDYRCAPLYPAKVRSFLLSHSMVEDIPKEEGKKEGKKDRDKREDWTIITNLLQNNNINLLVTSDFLVTSSPHKGAGSWHCGINSILTSVSNYGWPHPYDWLAVNDSALPTDRRLLQVTTKYMPTLLVTFYTICLLPHEDTASLRNPVHCVRSSHRVKIAHCSMTSII